MMKRLLALGLILISQYLVAQEDRLSIRIVAGAALPQGAFAESTNSASAGFAQNGIIGGFSLGIPIAKNVLVDFDFSRASYSVDQEVFSRVFKSQIQQLLPGSNLQTSINVGNYTNTTAFASLKLITGANGVFFYAKPGVGASWFSVPTVTANLTSGQDKVTTVTSYETAITLMFNLSAGVLFELSDNIMLDFNAQYLFADYDVDASTYVEDNNGNTQSTNLRTDADFSSLNLTIGLLFYINKNE